MPATNRGFIRSHGRDHVTHSQLTATLDQINDERTTLRHRLAQPTTPGIPKRRASPARLSQFDHLAHHATKNLASTTSQDQHRVYQLLASPPTDVTGGDTIALLARHRIRQTTDAVSWTGSVVDLSEIAESAPDHPSLPQSRVVVIGALVTARSVSLQAIAVASAQS